MLRTCRAGIRAPRPRREALLPRLRLLRQVLLLLRQLLSGRRGSPGRNRDIGRAQFVALPAVSGGGCGRAAGAKRPAGLTRPARATWNDPQSTTLVRKHCGWGWTGCTWFRHPGWVQGWQNKHGRERGIESQQ